MIKDTAYYRFQVYTHGQFIARVASARVARRTPMKLWESAVLEGDIYKLAMRFTGNPRQDPDALAFSMCVGNEDWEECRALFESEDYQTML
jgi:hypothetical protein